MLDLLLGYRKIISRENSQVSQLARIERSLLAVFRRKPTAPYGVELERFVSIQSVLFRIKTDTANGLAGDEPVQGEKGVVAGDSGCVRTRTNGNPHLEHAPDRWRSLRLLRAVALDKVLALESHSVLHSNAAA